jgi:hypothetical protein
MIVYELNPIDNWFGWTLFEQAPASAEQAGGWRGSPRRATRLWRSGRCGCRKISSKPSMQPWQEAKCQAFGSALPDKVVGRRRAGGRRGRRRGPLAKIVLSSIQSQYNLRAEAGANTGANTVPTVDPTGCQAVTRHLLHCVKGLWLIDAGLLHRSNDGANQRGDP